MYIVVTTGFVPIKEIIHFNYSKLYIQFIIYWLYRTSGIELFKLMFAIQVAVRSELWVCGRWIAGCAGSNPSSGRDICVFNSFVSIRRADYMSRGVLPIVVLLSVTVEHRK
jgi:hypothetical protein